MRSSLRSRLGKGGRTAAAGHGIAKVQVQRHAALHLTQSFIVRSYTVHQGFGAASILQIVNLAFEGVDFLPQGLNLVPGVSLSRLQLAQLHVLLLHLLFQ